MNLSTLLVTSIALVSSAAMAEQFCARQADQKACAEVGCQWLDDQQRCVDELPAPPANELRCVEISDPRECDASSRCEWWDGVCSEIGR